jgi:hypothetical protein
MICRGALRTFPPLAPSSVEGDQRHPHVVFRYPTFTKKQGTIRIAGYLLYEEEDAG